MTPGGVFAMHADGLPVSELNRNSRTHADYTPQATRRGYYEEMAEEQHSRIQRSPSLHDHYSQRSRIRDSSQASIESVLLESGGVPRTTQNSDGGSAWWRVRRQPNATRTGYWDIISLFRTSATIHTGE